MKPDARGASNFGAHFLPVLSLGLQRQSTNTIRGIGRGPGQDAVTDGWEAATVSHTDLWKICVLHESEVMMMMMIPRNLLGSNANNSPTVRSSSSGTTGSVQPMGLSRALT